MNTLYADLRANVRSPQALLAVLIYRYGNWVWYRCPARIKPLLWLPYKLVDLLVLRVLLGGEVSGKCRIGAGVHFPHGVNGVVIHALSVIGSDVTIYHQVTLGGAKGPDVHAPVIGDGVQISVGAKVLGPVEVGERAVIGANAVVLKDVPAGATAVGVPARIVSRSKPLIEEAPYSRSPLYGDVELQTLRVKR